MNKQRKGFTLIELLVVIAIIALLSTLAVVALNNAREKSRDAKRVSDVKQIQTALELYYADEGGYPAVASAVVLGATAQAELNSGGFTTVGGTAPVYMGQVPSNPTPNGADYSFESQNADGTACTAGDCASYEISFQLEGTTGSLDDSDTDGTVECTATPSGVGCE